MTEQSSSVTTSALAVKLGALVAHCASSKMLNYIEVEDRFTIVKMRPPKETNNFTLRELDLRNRYGIQVIGVRTSGEDFEYAGRNTTIHPDDLLVVAGDGELLERFARLPSRPALPRRDAPRRAL